MNELHALLHDPWCPKCGPTKWHITGPDPNCMCDKDVRLSLAERMPEVVPPGLDLGSECAVDCFIGRAVEVLAAYMPNPYPLEVTKWNKTEHGWTIELIDDSFDGPTFPAALAAALYSLADKRDAAKETT